MDYNKHIEELESLDTSSFSDPQKEALEEATDCLATVSALYTAMRFNGFNLPEEVDLSLFENANDLLMLELVASIMMLCQFEGIEDRMRQISKELREEADKGQEVDNGIIGAWGKLADRVEKSRAGLAKLKE